MKNLDVLCYLLVLIGALNWGLIGIFHFNLVDFIFGKTFIDKIIYALVGISAVYLILGHNNIKGRCCSKK
ncbi:MAG: DUF378 domain-containing protein [Chlamydiota bacterium]